MNESFFTFYQALIKECKFSFFGNKIWILVGFFLGLSAFLFILDTILVKFNMCLLDVFYYKAYTQGFRYSKAHKAFVSPDKLQTNRSTSKGKSKVSKPVKGRPHNINSFSMGGAKHSHSFASKHHTSKKSKSTAAKKKTKRR